MVPYRDARPQPVSQPLTTARRPAATVRLPEANRALALRRPRAGPEATVRQPEATARRP